MRNDESSELIRTGLAHNIRAIRTDCGHTQEELAEMNRMNRSYYSQIEQGKKNITIDMLVKIADGLDRPVPDFFNGMESASPRKLVQQNITYHLVKLPRLKKKKPRKKRKSRDE